ncbi:MAG TPA: hypothetical protein VII38_19535 [Polyangia bacterium]|jgi:hypothetical protein
MLIAVLVMGALVAYYFGLRAGGYAAAAVFGLSLLALFVPRFALPIQLLLAVGAVAAWRIGSRRPRPPDAVLAVRFIRGAVARLWSLLFGDRDR